MALCPTYSTVESIMDIVYQTQYVYDGFIASQILLCLIGLYIVFIRHYKSKKHSFIKVMWVLICIQEVSTAVMNFYLLSELDEHDLSREKRQKVWLSRNVLLTLNIVLCSITHWLFSIEYFRLSLRFPLLLGTLQVTEMEK